MSVVARSPLPVARLPMLSLAAGVAVAEALSDVAGLSARLKWPNDVLTSGRKIAGVLLERITDVVVIGIGVNVAQPSFGAELSKLATSIAIEGGRADREALLRGVLGALSRWRGALESGDFRLVLERWTALSATLGQRVSVDGVVGFAAGLDDDGALVLETVDGKRRIIAGEPEPVAG